MEDMIIIGTKLIVGLVLVIFIFRLLGRKELSQATPIDLLFIIIMGELFGGVSQNTDQPIWHVAYVIILWGFLIIVLEKVTSSIRLQKLIEGSPKVLVQHGKINKKLMKRENLTVNEIETRLRKKGVFSFSEVELAILEINGELSVKKKEHNHG